MTQEQINRYSEVAADVTASDLAPAKRAALLQSVELIADGNASDALVNYPLTQSDEWASQPIRTA